MATMAKHLKKSEKKIDWHSIGNWIYCVNISVRHFIIEFIAMFFSYRTNQCHKMCLILTWIVTYTAANTFLIRFSESIGLMKCTTIQNTFGHILSVLACKWDLSKDKNEFNMVLA